MTQDLWRRIRPSKAVIYPLAAVLLAMTWPSSAGAQTFGTGPVIPNGARLVRSVRFSNPAAVRVSPDALLRQPIGRLEHPTVSSPSPRARHITAGRVGKVALGIVGGFFAGGFIGARIEGHSCGCDDPGLRGFLIGAPIGAILGGIAGAKWF